MTYKSEILGFEIQDSLDKWPMNLPKKHSGWSLMFYLWSAFFGLKGTGYLIGEQKILSIIKSGTIKLKFPEVTKVIGVDLENADFEWNILKPFPNHLESADFIFCAQVLEHLIDPILAMRNMKKLMKNRGLLFIGVPRFGFKYHAFPIDCYRFSPDAIKCWEEYLQLTLIDWFLTKHNILALYRKET